MFLSPCAAIWHPSYSSALVSTLHFFNVFLYVPLLFGRPLLGTDSLFFMEATVSSSETLVLSVAALCPRPRGHSAPRRAPVLYLGASVPSAVMVLVPSERTAVPSEVGTGPNGLKAASPMSSSVIQVNTESAPLESVTVTQHPQKRQWPLPRSHALQRFQ